MSNLYYINYDSVYCRERAQHENTFSTMNTNVRVSSPLQYYKKDVVEITGVDEEGYEVRVLPVSDCQHKPDRAIVFLISTISLSSDSDYVFSSKAGIEILVNRRVEKDGNLRYLMIASVPCSPVSLLVGIDKVTGTRIEFIVMCDMSDEQDNTKVA